MGGSTIFLDFEFHFILAAVVCEMANFFVSKTSAASFRLLEGISPRNWEQHTISKHQTFANQPSHRDPTVW